MIVKKSKLPVSSKMMTRMPCSNPHSGSLAGQPGSAFTFTSDEGCGILSRMVHCDAVVGTWKIVIASSRKKTPLPGSLWSGPTRYGSTGAKNWPRVPTAAPE